MSRTQDDHFDACIRAIVDQQSRRQHIGQNIKSPPHLHGEYTAEQASDVIRKLTGNEPVAAYKFFGYDERLYSTMGRSGYYSPGKVYYVEGPLVFCENGFHACPRLEDLNSYAPHYNVAVHEVLLGDVRSNERENKIVGRYLYIGQRVLNNTCDWKSLGSRTRFRWQVDSHGIGSLVEQPDIPIPVTQKTLDGDIYVYGDIYGYEDHVIPRDEWWS